MAKRALFTVVALLACARPSVAEDTWPIHAALIGLNVVEVTEFGLTMYALGKGGLHEANPVLAQLAKSPAAVLIVKSSVDSAIALGIWKLHEKKPRLAFGLAIVGIVGYGAIALHNARLTNH